MSVLEKEDILCEVVVMFLESVRKLFEEFLQMMSVSILNATRGSHGAFIRHA